MNIEKSKLVSLVVAAYNEQDNLPELYRRVCEVDWASRGCDFEILIVDDHSTDSTQSILRHIAAGNPKVKWIRFSRNFGSHRAFAAGIELCSGNLAILLAADLQDPPEFALEMIDSWLLGNNVVWAVRAQREKESTMTVLLSRTYYWIMNHVARVETPPNGADYFLIDSAVMEALRLAPEKNTSLIALVQWVGFKQAWIYYSKMPRRSGQSKWTFSKKVKLAMDSFISFSYLPIRLMSLTGILFSALGLCYAVALAIRRVFISTPVEGWTSLICVVLVLSGVQLLTLGILGEYLWRAFEEIRKRPRYIIESSSGVEVPRGG